MSSLRDKYSLHCISTKSTITTLVYTGMSHSLLTDHWLEWLTLGLSEGPNMRGVSLHSAEDENRHSFWNTFPSNLEFVWWVKPIKPCDFERCTPSSKPFRFQNVKSG
jgi:hypothetical protein